MKTLIVGGGLSGLALAKSLQDAGEDYLLLEARHRFGGRIQTCHHEAVCFDLGPAWFWPGQPRIAALVAQLGLKKFDQFATGALTIEDERGHVQVGQGFSAMEGSWRLTGGMAALTDALAAGIPAQHKLLDAKVTRLERTGDRIRATLSNGKAVDADQVILAMPPRSAAQIAFSPTLSAQSMNAMRSVPTWMAGQAKAIVVYQTPFWREAGRSGDAMSRHGPMVEIHDASPAHGGPYALFGFIGTPPHGRRDETVLRQNLLAQLARLFGPQAADPTQLYLKDWAFDPLTATPADQAPLTAHPAYGRPAAMTGLWDNTLHFAGTEVAPIFGGFIEGALEAAEETFNILNLQRMI